MRAEEEEEEALPARAVAVAAGVGHCAGGSPTWRGGAAARGKAPLHKHTALLRKCVQRGHSPWTPATLAWLPGQRRVAHQSPRGIPAKRAAAGEHVRKKLGHPNPAQIISRWHEPFRLLGNSNIAPSQCLGEPSVPVGRAHGAKCADAVKLTLVPSPTSWVCAGGPRLQECEITEHVGEMGRAQEQCLHAASGPIQATWQTI